MRKRHSWLWIWSASSNFIKSNWGPWGFIWYRVTCNIHNESEFSLQSKHVIDNTQTTLSIQNNTGIQKLLIIEKPSYCICTCACYWKYKHNIAIETATSQWCIFDPCKHYNPTLHIPVSPYMSYWTLTETHTWTDTHNWLLQAPPL